jgi:hypothetical protein
MKLEKSSPEFADALGQAIVALSYSMCGVDLEAAIPPGGVVQGFNKLAPEYIRVTENRDGPTPQARENYSSCGDQLHEILRRVGVRLPFVNRASLNGKFAYGQNIIWLQKPHCPFAISPPKDPNYRPPTGSLCLIWTNGLDAHALTILGPGSDDKHILTGNYGAGGMSKEISPGANVSDSPCVPEMKPVLDKNGKKVGETPTGNILIGGRRRTLHTVITPASIVPYIDAQIDLSGARVTDDLISALGARYE